MEIDFLVFKLVFNIKFTKLLKNVIILFSGPLLLKTDRLNETSSFSSSYTYLYDFRRLRHVFIKQNKNKTEKAFKLRTGLISCEVSNPF